MRIPPVFFLKGKGREVSTGKLTLLTFVITRAFFVTLPYSIYCINHASEHPDRIMACHDCCLFVVMLVLVSLLRTKVCFLKPSGSPRPEAELYTKFIVRQRRQSYGIPTSCPSLEKSESEICRSLQSHSDAGKSKDNQSSYVSVRSKINKTPWVHNKLSCCCVERERR